MSGRFMTKYLTIIICFTTRSTTTCNVYVRIGEMRVEHENIQLYLDRYYDWVRSEWRALSSESLDLLCEHIRNNDLPQTAIELEAMTTHAGFIRCREINRFRWHHTWCFERSIK